MKIKVEDLHHLSTTDGGIFKVHSLHEAQDFCKKIAAGHYENFPVGSVLISKDLRPHYFSVYAYSRIADDFADELTHLNKKELLILLDNYADMLSSEEYSDKKTGNPIFIALRHTMVLKNIPAEPLLNLLTAFKQDIHFKQALTMNDHLDYCRYSANPVGELVLRIHGQYNTQTAILSDKICTALQLVNFWQDISRDLKINRQFIPLSYLKKYNLDNESLNDSAKAENFQECLNELYDFTQLLFAEGSALIPILKGFRLRKEIKLVSEGGQKILSKLRRLGTVVITERPKLRTYDTASLFFKVLFTNV